MAEQITHNCHYVSRLVTRPWEGHQRFLQVYDFDEDRFSKRSSRSLFAEQDINSPAVEAWLQSYVEDPLGSIRQQLAYGDVHALEHDWKRFRAANLMLWLQGVRVRTIRDQDARSRLDILAATPEPEIDWLVNEFGKTFDLRLVPTDAQRDSIAMLYVPSTALFPVVLRDAGCRSKYSFGFALPIHLNCALVVSPAERHGALDVASLPGLLQRFSVGTSKARQVVVPPALLAQVGEDSARNILREIRRLNDQAVDLVHEGRELIASASREFGIDLAVDDAGRIPPA